MSADYVRRLEQGRSHPSAGVDVIAVNGAFMALGHWEPTADPWEWNIAWRTFCDPFGRFQQSAADATDHQAVLVARLKSGPRAAAGALPGKTVIVARHDDAPGTNPHS
jgi:hypothetical protein